MPETYEARLVANREGDIYRAHWIESADGPDPDPFPLVLPLSEADLDRPALVPRNLPRTGPARATGPEGASSRGSCAIAAATCTRPSLARARAARSTAT